MIQFIKRYSRCCGILQAIDQGISSIPNLFEETDKNSWTRHGKPLKIARSLRGSIPLLNLVMRRCVLALFVSKSGAPKNLKSTSERKLSGNNRRLKPTKGVHFLSPRNILSPANSQWMDHNGPGLSSYKCRLFFTNSQRSGPRFEDRAQRGSGSVKADCKLFAPLWARALLDCYNQIISGSWPHFNSGIKTPVATSYGRNIWTTYLACVIFLLTRQTHLTILI